MSKCTDIRDFLGDYAFVVEYSEDNKFTMFFNSLRNAKTVKRCIEVDDSVPNAATAVDFVEVVRCKDCKHYEIHKPSITLNCEREGKLIPMMPNDFCSYGERSEI